MRRWLYAVAVVAVLAAPLGAQQFSYLAGETITVAATAIGFTQSLIIAGSGHQQAETAICSLETGDVRYWPDGTTPTASTGIYWTAGTGPLAFGGNQVLTQIKFIRVTSTSGKLTCNYSNP